jgi:hypothetical protein
VHQLLSSGALDAAHQHHPTNRRWPALDLPALRALRFSTAGMQLSSAYLSGLGREPPLTNKHPAFSGCLDYIWLSSRRWQVAAVLEMPYQMLQRQKPSEVQFPSIPDRVWPSDHLALAADVVMVEDGLGLRQGGQEGQEGQQEQQEQ